MKTGAHGVEDGESEFRIVAVKRGGYNGAAVGSGNEAVGSGGVVGDDLQGLIGVFGVGSDLEEELLVECVSGVVGGFIVALADGGFGI